MSNQLYGSHYIERQRSAGYKSSIYAMAEIVDNAVDAHADKIKIVLSEKEVYSGNRSRSTLDKIFFLDNGNGMTESILNTCLTFSEGAGRNDNRIGAFGVGLPNSSISTCKRVEVYSRKKNGNWQYVFLDVDDQLTRSEPGFDKAKEKTPNFDELAGFCDQFNTIVVWSELDKIDVSRAATLISRSEKLIGRIYRYKLEEGLKISFEAYRQGKSIPIIEEKKVLPYDPLYRIEKENYMTSLIWQYANEEDPKGKTPELGHLEEFNSMYYFKKYVEGCKPNQNRPLFQKCEEFWEVPYEKKLNGKTYTWTIKASYAYADIANPGTRNGGGTEIGKEFGAKMSGSTHFKSGNIFFIRAGREIDFGSFGLYTVTDEKNRFWTIEIHFDSDLDELMGISNTKQSINFKYIKNSELEGVNESEEISLGLQREILWAQMSEAMKRCIRDMRADLSLYAKNFKDKVEAHKRSLGGEQKPIPEIEPAVIQVLAKGEPWTEDQKDEVSQFLKEKFMNVDLKSIKKQVENYAKGLTKTYVIYAPNETGRLFELKEIRGKYITLINSNHIFFQNIIDPLKSHPQLKVFAIAIEMLIGSCSLEMDRLMLENEEKYREPLEAFLLQISFRLSEFISDSRISINPEEFNRELMDELELS